MQWGFAQICPLVQGAPLVYNGIERRASTNFEFE